VFNTISGKKTYSLQKVGSGQDDGDKGARVRMIIKMYMHGSISL